MSNPRRGSQPNDGPTPAAAKSGSTNLSALGSIVPDRDAFRRDMLSVLPGQFVGHKVSSSSQLDGLSWTGPATGPPLPLTVPCGLSRPQFLLAAQAASLPCFPSYSQQDGGVVLDRVLLATGRDRWWTTLTGRLKAQQLLGVKKASTWRDTLGNPEHYSLCHNTSISLPSRAHLRTKLTYTPRSANSPAPATSNPSNTLKLGTWSVTIPDWMQTALQHRRHMAAAASLRRKLKHSELTADLGLEQEVLGQPGNTLPLHASVDIRTAPNQTSYLQYRLGVQHLVTRSSVEGEGHTASTHLRAAAALQGHHTLWSGSPAARREANRRRQRKQAAKQAGPGAAAGTAASDAQPGEAAGGGGQGTGQPPRRSKAIGPHNPIRQVLQKMLRGGGGGGAAGGSQPELTSSSSRGVEQGEQGAGGLLKVPVDQLPQPEVVQEAVIDATQSIKRLREDVQSLSDWVSSGSFTQQLEQIQKKPGVVGSSTRTPARPAPAPHKPAEPSPPWSSIVGRPHLRVAGLLGMYAQQPLWPPHRNGVSQVRVAVGGAAAEGQQGGEAAAGGPSAGAARLLARTNTLSADLIRAGVAWLTSSYDGPHSGVSKVRPFASLGASAQAGWFQQNVLDFTRVSARLDLGCPGHACQPDAGAGGRWSWLHEPLPYWHALSICAVQQLVGPVRLCADLRYALDPAGGNGSSHSSGEVASAGQQRPHDMVVSHLRHTMRRVRSTRPHLADAVVGLDMVLPGSAGFARLAAWYAPLKKEAMVELRLL